MEFLSEVSFDRIQPQHRWGHASECKGIVGADDLRFPEDGIAKGDVHPETLTIELARQAALRTKSEAFVPHTVVLQLRVLGVRSDFESHEILKIQSSGLPKVCEYAIR